MPAMTFESVLGKATEPTGCGVLVVRDGRVLTGTRKEKASRGQICGPGGHIEPGETPKQAARRETYEEFGIICEDLKPLGVMDGGSRYGRSAVFMCNRFRGTPKTDEEEMTDPEWLTIGEVKERDLFKPFEQSLALLPREKVLKFNPYHSAADGKFTTGPGGGSGGSNTSANRQKEIDSLKQELANTKGLISRAKLKNKIEALENGYDDVEEWEKVKAEKQRAKIAEAKAKQEAKEKAEKEKEAKRKEAERKEIEREMQTQPKQKVEQFKIIQENNPMLDDYHVGIRKPSDIKTWKEVIDSDDGSGESFAWGDFSNKDAKAALKSGKITIYSSKPIDQGGFVSTSKRQAEEYAGGKGNKVYSKTVPLDDVAWINGDEGQMARVNNSRNTKKSLTFDEILKFNPNHDHLGRFSSGPGGGSAAGDMKISTFSTGASGDEVYMRSEIKDGDKLAGYVEYSVYNDVPAIQYIHTEDDFKRQGVATKLMQDLQRQYPDKEIEFGMTTPDGTKFLDSITYEVKNEKVAAQKKELQSLKDEMTRNEAELNRLYDKMDNDTLSEDENKKLDKLGERWDELNDGIRDLEDDLWGKKETMRFVRLDDTKKSFTFDEILKFNPYHSPADGKFTSGPGGGSSANVMVPRGLEVTDEDKKLFSGISWDQFYDDDDKVDRAIDLYGEDPDLVEAKWYYTNLSEGAKGAHEIPVREVDDIVGDHIKDQWSVLWFREANSEIKPKIENAILTNPDLRNAALNVAYLNYKGYARLVEGKDQESLPDFNEWLTTPITVYRGERKGQKHIEEDVFLSYSYNRKIAEGFGDIITEKKVRPIDTLGGMKTNGEYELMVPNRKFDISVGKSITGGESMSKDFTIFKADDDKHLVFGWASISITIDGEELEDRQHDIIDPEDLEEAAYEYVLDFRDAGEEHIETMRKRGRLVESCVFTKEKQRAIGIPEGSIPVGWWVGFKIDDEDAWRRVKSGMYKMFSIEGRANRKPVQKRAYDLWLEDNLDKFSSEDEEIKFAHWKSPDGLNPRHADDVDEIDMIWDEYKRTGAKTSQNDLNSKTAKSFNDVLEKFNPFHDQLGRFSTANGGVSFTWRTKDPSKQHWADMAAAREKERTRDWKDTNPSSSKPDTKPKDTKKPDTSNTEFKSIDTAGVREMQKEMGQKYTREDIEQMNRRGWDKGYFGTANSFDINESLRDGKKLSELNEDDRKTCETLDRNMKPITRDIKLTRMVEDGFFEQFGIDPTKAASDSSELQKAVGKVYSNKGYTSTSYDVSENVFNSRNFKLNISAPKGTNVVIRPGHSEAEILLARNTGMVVKSIRKAGRGFWGDKYEVDLEVIV